MNCNQARRILYPEPEKCAVTIKHGGAMQHLRDCADCKAYFHGQAEWSRLLKEKIGVEKAPDALHKYVAKSILQDREQQTLGPREFGRRRLLLAVLAVLLVFPAVWLVFLAPSASFFDHICEDHARYLDAQAQVQASEPEVVEKWFRGKTTFAIQVPALESAQLLGGRLCFLRGRQAALIFYREAGRAVSLFQFSKEGVSLRALDRATIDGVPVWRGSFKGYNLAAFTQRGMVYVMVSDLRESELLRLVSEARIESRGY